jgi:Mucin-2 protein WxxW repeating region
MTYRLIALSLALISVGARAETLTAYVQRCENELGFAASDVPALNCNDALRFADGSNSRGLNPENDYVGHKRLTDSVDLVFACRWLNNGNTTAVSVELLVHNRQSGGTCFFAAKDPNNTPAGTNGLKSTAIVSPADVNAPNYWMQPAALNNKIVNPFGSTPNARLRCVGCHVAGPYIASPRIAPFLAQFGLLNDGHDTFANRYHAVGSCPALHVCAPTGAAFTFWDDFIFHANVSGGCADACHSIGSNSSADNISDIELGDTLIPALKDDIFSVAVAGVMPANAPANGNPDSDYRWVNMDTPTNGDDGEYETLSNLGLQYPQFSCSNPTSLQAHVVDSDAVMSPVDLPDRLRTFNLQDGLVCINGEQDGGRKCNDYQTRYVCNGVVTAWQSRDLPSGSGDWETRNSFTACSSPTAIQARTKVAGRWIYADGPSDRLAEFDNGGLICHNVDQNAGQTCSNYVVRFGCASP